MAGVVMQRKTLRRQLGQNRIGSFVVGTSSWSLNTGAAFAVVDTALANADEALQNKWQGAYVRAGSADYRVGSFNTGSGAFLSAQTVRGAALASGGDFEVSQKISPADMDRYLDETIALMRFRQEVALPTVEGNTRFYAIDTVASPNTIKSVLNAYYYSDPTSTTNRGRVDLTQDQIVFTATGMEIRLPAPAGLDASMQIVLDAMLQMTLGASDAATVNIVDTETILWGAAARVWDRLMVDSPGSEYGNYGKLNQRAAQMYTHLSKKNVPEIDHKIGFDSPIAGRRLDALSDWW